MVWVPLEAAEVLSQNRYGSAATRRTLWIAGWTVKSPPGEPRPNLGRPERTASVEVGETAAGVRLGVLDAAEESGQDFAQDGAFQR